MYQVKLEKYSRNVYTGKEVASFIITFPRVVLAEIVTHRMNSECWTNEVSMCERSADPMISKNSASSRAIPFNRMVASVMDNPYVPVWTLQQKGMQGATMTDEEIIRKANNEWLLAMDDAIAHARTLHDKFGVHKQDCNRLLEPWQWVTQIVTSSNWDNFFALRCHEKAFPPFRKLARMMYLEMRKHKPRELCYGQWHLPFVADEIANEFNWKISVTMKGIHLPYLIKQSAARCAWVSYNNHDKECTTEAVERTINSLFGESPIHGSPLEHQCTTFNYHGEQFRSNLTGFLQARKLINDEKVQNFIVSDEEIASWTDV